MIANETMDTAQMVRNAKKRRFTANDNKLQPL